MQNLNWSRNITIGVVVGVVAALIAGTMVFFGAPPIPLGGWTVYGLVAASVFAAVIAFFVVWFLTVLSCVLNLFRNMEM